MKTIRQLFILIFTLASVTSLYAKKLTICDEKLSQILSRVTSLNIELFEQFRDNPFTMGTLERENIIDYVQEIHRSRGLEVPSDMAALNLFFFRMPRIIVNVNESSLEKYKMLAEILEDLEFYVLPRSDEFVEKLSEKFSKSTETTKKVLQELDLYVAAKLDLPEQHFLTSNNIWGDFERHNLSDEQVGGFQERALPFQRIDTIVNVLLARNRR